MTTTNGAANPLTSKSRASSSVSQTCPYAAFKDSRDCGAALIWRTKSLLICSVSSGVGMNFSYRQIVSRRSVWLCVPLIFEHGEEIVDFLLSFKYGAAVE